ncbi:head decoration protein [Sneathiella sp.]|uniref:head decoration protein n=1 Tax=Sneathiella sp. TaxID=1964365 RepID=UPI002FE26010
MANLEMGPRESEFLISEASGYRSREQITLASGAGALETGTVLAVVTATGKYVALDQDGEDGSEVAAGVLYRDADATSADARSLAIVRDAEVNAINLIWPDDIDAGEKVTAIGELEAAGIIVR